jgi:hypothetical protein
VTLKGDSVARAFLKAAAAQNAGAAVGKALRSFARGTKATVEGGGAFGQGVAEGLGRNGDIGRRVGKATTVVAGGAGAVKAKDKADEFRYRHGLYAGQGY